jgi:hypothetical protein
MLKSGIKYKIAQNSHSSDVIGLNVEVGYKV